MLSNWKGQEEKNYTNVKLVSTPGPLENRKDGPKFVVLGEDFKETTASFTEVVGKVSWVKWTFTPAKGKRWDIYGFKAFIEDGSEVVVIESTITNASKDMLNALINAKWANVKISLYVNKNGYPSSSVKDADGNFIKWALDFKEANQVNLYNAINLTYVANDDKASVSDAEAAFA